ncbi:MAG TPA: saccharopine dehydrogenase NADP-binding domain-containing protein [Polyangiales bacterium]|nr:saccharopine dehydrogenase NADP-binding domain-containing protein [Polyangiales bacterium]
MKSEAREFDLVLFGASGFTGGLVAEHVATHARAGLRIALAGRRADKLHALRERLMAAHPSRRHIGVIVADVSDPASLTRMAASARAVLSTVGPFVDYGEPLIKACVEQGTDYLDSTGERPFVLSMIERYDAAARARGVRLIFACGFDSIPADLGVYFTVHQLPVGSPIEVASYLSFQGSFSGGTKRSAIKELAAERPPAEAYAFAEAERIGRVIKGSAHCARSIGWVTPFFDAVDSNIVLRSAKVIDRYGPRFTYKPWVVYPNMLSMLLLMLVGLIAGALARITPIRTLLLKLVAPSGQGPTPEQMAKGWFRVRFEAESGKTRVSTEVSGGDPGYGATSMMLGQSALCLLEDREHLPQRSGVVTTAAAFGDKLLARLQAHGLQFRVLPQSGS